VAVHHVVAQRPGRPVGHGGMSVALDDVHGRLAEQRAHDHRPDQRRTRGGQGVGGSSGLLPPK